MINEKIDMNEKKNLTLKETFALAVQNHQKNNLKAAENLYNSLPAKPEDPMALVFQNAMEGLLKKKTRNIVNSSNDLV